MKSLYSTIPLFGLLKAIFALYSKKREIDFCLEKSPKNLKLLAANKIVGVIYKNNINVIINLCLRRYKSYKILDINKDEINDKPKLISLLKKIML